MQNLEFIKCYYRPSFFRMKIDLPVDLSNLRDITDGTFSLYFHEYIHFIQDISTIYGLMNISTITYYIQDVAHRVGKQQAKEFTIPMPLLNDNRDYGFNNFALRKFYIGSGINPKHTKINLVSYRKKMAQWGESPEDELPVVIVEAKDLNTQEHFEFEFGGNHITEGMAYLCEQYVYSDILKQQGHIIPADEYPYLVALKIAELIYPELAKEPLLVIAACDASLMTYHPGLSYIRLLDNLRQTDFLSNEIGIGDLYNRAKVLLKGSHEDFDTVLETVRNEIKLNFKDKNFEGNNQWVDLLFDRIKDFRSKVPEFITDILQFGDLKKNEIFGMFHSLFGSPLVLNGEEDATISLPLGFIPNNFHPSLFWAINQMLRIFSNQQPTPCELKEYCLKSSRHDPKLKVDSRCDTAPWERCQDTDLCPVAIVWRHWGLSPYVPVPQAV